MLQGKSAWTAPVVLTAVLTVTMTAGSSGACAASLADFYKGRSVTMFIGGSAGGTNTAYARMVARHIKKYLPGNPHVVPKNMPGAGGLKIMNYLYKVAPKDGTAMGVAQRSVIVQPLLGIRGADFDPLEFSWIGSTNSEVSTGVAWGTSKVKTLQDAMKHELVIGSSGVGNDTGAFPRILNYFLGTKFKPVYGYKSGGDILLAIERKEVAGRVGWSWSSVKSNRPQWIKDKTVNIIVQIGIKKAPDLDAPLALDFAKNAKDKAAMKVVFAATTIGWPSLLPPKVSKDKVKAFRAAYSKTVRDQDFLKEAKKSRLAVDPMSGEEIQKIIAEIYGSPQEVVELARKATAVTGQLTKVKLMTAKGVISKINKKGSRLQLRGSGKTVNAIISRRSKIKIAKMKASRRNLKKGLNCAMTLAASGAVAHTVTCD